jgi:hypothetical protein
MNAHFYTVPDLLEVLQMSERTFRRLHRSGGLPFLEELKPRLGRRPRYRADLIDRYLQGRWSKPMAFAAARAR